MRLRVRSIHASIASASFGSTPSEINCATAAVAGLRRSPVAYRRANSGIISSTTVSVWIDAASGRPRLRVAYDDQARATYTDGILRIELPLARPEARSRSVPIDVARGQDVVEGR